MSSRRHFLLCAAILTVHFVMCLSFSIDDYHDEFDEDDAYISSRSRGWGRGAGNFSFEHPGDPSTYEGHMKEKYGDRSGKRRRQYSEDDYEMIDEDEDNAYISSRTRGPGRGSGKFSFEFKGDPSTYPREDDGIYRGREPYRNPNPNRGGKKGRQYSYNENPFVHQRTRGPGRGSGKFSHEYKGDPSTFEGEYGRERENDGIYRGREPYRNPNPNRGGKKGRQYSYNENPFVHQRTRGPGRGSGKFSHEYKGDPSTFEGEYGREREDEGKIYTGRKPYRNPNPNRGGKKGRQSSAEYNAKLAENGLPNEGLLPEAGSVMGRMIGSKVSTISKNSLSGIARALDDRLIQIDAMGNPYGGMPEDVTTHIKFCAQFIYSGLYALIYINVRYPFKMLTKAVIMTGAVTHIATYANWCINPVEFVGLTTEGKKINEHLERIAQFKEEFKKRLIWVTDKARPQDRQMYICCAWHEYKRKIYEEAPESRSLTKLYFVGLYKIPEIIYWYFRSNVHKLFNTVFDVYSHSMKYQEGSDYCAKVDMTETDAEVDRPTAQSFITHTLELLDKYL